MAEANDYPQPLRLEIGGVGRLGNRRNPRNGLEVSTLQSIPTDTTGVAVEGNKNAVERVGGDELAKLRNMPHEMVVEIVRFLDEVTFFNSLVSNAQWGWLFRNTGPAIIRLQDLNIPNAYLPAWFAKCAQYGNLRHVQYLDMNGCGVTDALMPYIADCKHLLVLNLRNCDQITDAGLQHVTGLNKLSSLHLGGFRCKKVTDAGLVHVGKLKQLTSLNMADTENITDAGLVHVGKLTQLRRLNLSGLLASSLEYLAGLDHLLDLKLRYCDNITDASLQYVARLKKLRKLDLYCCETITDAGLKHLRGLEFLQQLDLRKCDGITHAVLLLESDIRDMQVHQKILLSEWP
jgi:hypothetical protein